MNNNVCPECGTENEEQYLYCKNCGAELKTEAKSESENNRSTSGTEQNNTYGYYSFNEKNQGPDFNQNYNPSKNFFYNTYGVEHIGGISMEELGIFVGKKANDIIPKFAKMELTKTKVSWCWPAAILGFLFGPMGLALWFFYRKMYKPAIILSVIGAVLTLITSLLTFGSVDINYEAFFNSIMSGNFDAALDSFEESTSILSMISSLLSDVSSFGAGIIGGLFSYHVYKLHSVAKIHEFKITQADSRYYQFGLASIGGVSGGMLALGLIIMCGVNYITNFVMTFGDLLLDSLK